MLDRRLIIRTIRDRLKWNGFACLTIDSERGEPFKSMRPVPFFSGHVDGFGQLVFEDFAAFSKHIARYKHNRVRVTIRRATSVRTLSQNRRLWLLYQTIADWSGHDPEEIHEAMKQKFLAPRTLETPKGMLDAPPTTRVLSIEDFGAYMERLEAWMVEQGCQLPDWSKVE